MSLRGRTRPPHPIGAGALFVAYRLFAEAAYSPDPVEAPADAMCYLLLAATGDVLLDL
jgi:hypothetical protein